MMFVVLFVCAGVVGGAPAAAVVLVAVASRGEESAQTLGSPAAGMIRSASRRILGFHAHGIDWSRAGLPGGQPVESRSDMRRCAKAGR